MRNTNGTVFFFLQKGAERSHQNPPENHTRPNTTHMEEFGRLPNIRFYI